MTISHIVYFSENIEQKFAIYSLPESPELNLLLTLEDYQQEGPLPLQTSMKETQSERTFKSGQKYNHKKNKPYLGLLTAYDAKTGEPYAVYRALYDNCAEFARPIDMFLEYIQEEHVYRFVEI